MGLLRRKAAKPPASQTLADRAAAAEPPTPEPTPSGAGIDALDELRAELASMKERLDASDRANADLEATVESLNQRLIVTPPPPAPPPPEPVESVTVAQHADTVAAIDRLESSLGNLDQRIQRLDDRVTSVSTELANQLTEIGDDIEPMHDSAERLAAEQARYQIQFRQDLAELAERIRRPGAS